MNLISLCFRSLFGHNFLPPISVCFTVGFSSWYTHILRLSVSVRVLLGVEVEWVEVLDGVAETGVEVAAGLGADIDAEIGVEAEAAGAVETFEGAKVDWLVNMLGHCGIINGCNC